MELGPSRDDRDPKSQPPKDTPREYPARCVDHETLAAEKRSRQPPSKPNKRQERASPRSLSHATSTVSKVQNREPSSPLLPGTNSREVDRPKVQEPGPTLPEPPQHAGIPPLAPIGLADGAEPYSIVKDLQETAARISVAQTLMLAAQARKELVHELKRKP